MSDIQPIDLARGVISDQSKRIDFLEKQVLEAQRLLVALVKDNGGEFRVSLKTIRDSRRYEAICFREDEKTRQMVYWIE